ncbi:MAG: 50S ribosomal protein L21e [Candidatus Aenigmarchaeota archaeon]|nr:50S ribosomal protein L21e [Candidatus Aenigmarchaeota archaeon]
MVRASSGYRRGGRTRLQNRLRDKFSVERRMRSFQLQDRVIIDIDPSSHKGMPPLKFAGFMGTIRGKRGDCYLVALQKGNMNKEVIARPEHIRRVY